ncbi:MAG: RNA methyltransferase, partial [Pseudomonadota bacterium]|nr:RNA methyltransferase [Pseudomonadota bacterium]
MVEAEELLERIKESVRFILVGTSHPGNIGASARAMKNMVLKNMELVSPKDFPNETAFFRAKFATDILEEANIHPDLKSTISRAKLVIGTSARIRKVPWPIVSPKEAAQEIINLCIKGEENIAIIFGREDRGLTNEELGLCNLHVHIPTTEEYSSLNLSQAVQIIAYEIRLSALNHSGAFGEQEWDVPLASTFEIERLIDHFDEVMQQVDFYQVDNPRNLLTRVRRFFKR